MEKLSELEIAIATRTHRFEVGEKVVHRAFPQNPMVIISQVLVVAQTGYDISYIVLPSVNGFGMLIPDIELDKWVEPTMNPMDAIRLNMVN